MRDLTLAERVTDRAANLVVLVKRASGNVDHETDDHLILLSLSCA
jgi:hypothetical protein